MRGIIIYHNDTRHLSCQLSAR